MMRVIKSLFESVVEDILEQHKVAMTELLDMETLIPHLVAVGLVTPEEIDRLRPAPPHFVGKDVIHFLSQRIIKPKGEEGLRKFITALEQSAVDHGSHRGHQGHRELLERLQQDETYRRHFGLDGNYHRRRCSGQCCRKAVFLTVIASILSIFGLVELFLGIASSIPRSRFYCCLYAQNGSDICPNDDWIPLCLLHLCLGCYVCVVILSWTLLLSVREICGKYRCYRLVLFEVILCTFIPLLFGFPCTVPVYIIIFDSLPEWRENTIACSSIYYTYSVCLIFVMLGTGLIVLPVVVLILACVWWIRYYVLSGRQILH